MKLLIGLLLVSLPLKDLRVNSGFGYRLHPITGKLKLHEGVDLKARHDTVYAVLAGSVAEAGYDPGLGIHVRLCHGAVETIYGHLSRLLVLPHDTVTAGEAIGITGATGRVTGEHLHFSVRYWDRYIDPLKFLYELLIKTKNE